MSAPRYAFDDLMISEVENFSIGLERTTGRHFIGVVASDGFVEEDRRYELSDEEFHRLLDDPEAAQALARRCRAGEEEARRFPPDESAFT